MNKNLYLIIIFFFFTSALIAQNVIKDFDDAKIYFHGLFEEPSRLDEYGNVEIDMGAASAGRIKFRISDVVISMEERPEEPGCADICPPRILITFTCKKSECISDPAFTEFTKSKTGTIQIHNINRGKKSFRFLKELQKFLDAK